MGFFTFRALRIAAGKYSKLAEICLVKNEPSDYAYYVDNQFAECKAFITRMQTRMVAVTEHLCYTTTNVPTLPPANVNYFKGRSPESRRFA